MPIIFMVICSSKSTDPDFEAAASHSLCSVCLQLISFIELQANELLHALPVLHLGGAVGVILT